MDTEKIPQPEADTVSVPGNLEGPDRPSDNPRYEGYSEVNPREGITGNELMSSDLNGPESDYEGWNGVDDIPQAGYGDLLGK